MFCPFCNKNLAEIKITKKPERSFFQCRDCKNTIFFFNHDKEKILDWLIYIAKNKNKSENLDPKIIEQIEQFDNIPPGEIPNDYILCPLCNNKKIKIVKCKNNKKNIFIQCGNCKLDAFIKSEHFLFIT